MWQIEFTLHAGEERDHEPEGHPEREEPVHAADDGVLEQIRRVTARGGALVLEQPAHVRMP
jgi:hypothetical protein